MFCFALHFISSFLHTLRTVNHNFPTTYHNFPCFPFFGIQILSYFPSDMVHKIGCNSPYIPEVDIFHQKEETYSKCCLSKCTMALPGFHILDQKLIKICFTNSRFFQVHKFYFLEAINFAHSSVTKVVGSYP